MLYSWMVRRRGGPASATRGSSELALVIIVAIVVLGAVVCSPRTASRIYVVNKCGRDIDLAVRYLRKNGTWEEKAWWHVKAKSDGFLFHHNHNFVHAYANTVYFHAKGTGQKSKKCLFYDGRCRPMHPADFVGNDIVITVNCGKGSSDSPHPRRGRRRLRL